MKININNQPAIEEKLKEAQRYCRARTVSYAEIVDTVLRIEKTLSTLLYKADWKDVEFHVDLSAQGFASAYRGIPESTQFVLLRGSRDWFVTSIKRDKVRRASGREVSPNFKAVDPSAFARHAADPEIW